MKIDETGISITDLEQSLKNFENHLKNKFGSDFSIKPEGVIDNIATTSGLLKNDIQEQIAILATQFDPESVEGIWQDALYERIGVTRLEAQKSTFVLKVQGAANLVCNARSITIRSKSDNNEFENISEFTTDENGIALVDFQCVIDGAIEVKSTDEFLIVTAPDGITSVAQADDLQFSIGRERESDNEFRIRFRNSKALNAKATHNACIANLSKYVDDTKFLRIVDKKVDTIGCGINLLGDTEITVYDLENHPVKIKFQNAEEVEVSIEAEVKVRSGYYNCI